jgi:hypothetical protein
MALIDDARFIVQLSIGLVFLLSAPGKLASPTRFAKGVKAYRILPESLAYYFGLLIISSEAFLTVSHLTGWQLAFAVPLGLAVVVSIATAVLINLKRGQVLPCYCFGTQGRETISRRTLARLLLLLAGEFLLLTDPNLFRTDKLIYPNVINSFSEFCLAILGAVILLVSGFWLLRLNDLIELLRP